MCTCEQIMKCIYRLKYKKRVHIGSLLVLLQHEPLCTIFHDALYQGSCRWDKLKKGKVLSFSIICNCKFTKKYYPTVFLTFCIIYHILYIYTSKSILMLTVGQMEWDIPILSKEYFHDSQLNCISFHIVPLFALVHSGLAFVLLWKVTGTLWSDFCLLTLNGISLWLLKIDNWHMISNKNKNK